MIDSFDAEMRQTQAAGGSAQVIEKTTDAELAWLYAHSLFTIYPSLYEGWGLPVGESLWFNTPCLASSATSIPEVGRNLVKYIDPYAPDDISKNIISHLTQDRLIENLREQIATSTLRTWKDHAEDVILATQKHLQFN